MSSSTLMNRTGKFVEVSTTGGRIHAYVPPSLPPMPPIRVSGLLSLFEEANQNLGKVSGIVGNVPDPSHLAAAFLRREALLSSQIEGTQSSFHELLLFETELYDIQDNRDTQETLNCLKALRVGLESIEKGVPVSVRLIRQMHQALFSSGKEGTGQIGEFRRSQNWIGGTSPSNATFVPPPHYLVGDLMSDLEKFYHAEHPVLPKLLKVALVHAQFEQIHPFLDGNGRVGRMLMMLMLARDTLLDDWVLTLSLYFKEFRDEYYRKLLAVSENGDWEGWLEFFLRGVVYTSKQTISAAHNIVLLFEQDQHFLSQQKAPASTIGVYQLLQQQPVLTSSRAKALLDASGVNRSMPTIRNALKRLEGLGIVDRVSSNRRTQAYQYTNYVQVLAQGTDPL